MRLKDLIVILSIIVCLFTIYDFSKKSPSLNFEAETITLPCDGERSVVGLAPFAITKSDFNCQSFINSLSSRDEYAISFLFNTFGNKFECIKRVMADDRLKGLQIHLINEPGHRNGRLGSYEFLRPVSSPAALNRLLVTNNRHLYRRFIRYVAPVQKLLAENLKSGTECVINPGLESNVSVQAGKTYTQWARVLFPQCTIVWNPIQKSSASQKNRIKTGADYVEQHTATPHVQAPCIVNLDGTDISFPSRPPLDDGNAIQSNAIKQFYVQKYSYCKYVFLWVREYNCIKPGKFIDPRKRVCNNTNLDRLMGNLLRSL